MRAKPHNAGRRGNAMLETALVFLPMMALYFGILDIALGVFLQSTFNNAVRAGTRFAVLYSTSYGANSCAASQSACIVQAVQDNAVGFLNGTKNQYIAVRYYTANDLGNPVMTCPGNGTCTQSGTLPQTLPNGKSVQYANQPGNVVEVAVVSYPLQWMVPIRGFSAGNGVSLSATSSDVLGGLASGTTPPNP